MKLSRQLKTIDDGTYQILARNFRRQRLARNLSQADLARLLGVTVDRIEGFETARELPDTLTLIHASHVYQVAVDHLLFNPDPTHRCGPVCPIYKGLCEVFDRFEDPQWLRVRRLGLKFLGMLTSESKLAMLEHVLTYFGEDYSGSDPSSERYGRVIPIR